MVESVRKFEKAPQFYYGACILGRLNAESNSVKQAFDQGLIFREGLQFGGREADLEHSFILALPWLPR
jgi:hypothetical protein